MTYVGAIDQGTTSTKFTVFNALNGDILFSESVPIKRICPQPGWVEVDAYELYRSVVTLLNKSHDVITESDSEAKIVCVGLTNQRETIIAWDKKTGAPYCNGIVWSDTRTDSMVTTMIKKNILGNVNQFIEKTGLPMNSYFSAFKIKWLVCNDKDVKKAYDFGDLCVGTVDSWLIYNLSDRTTFITDVTNASRTMLMNIKTLKWDDSMLKFFDLKKEILPQIVDSCGNLANILDPNIKWREVVITSILGDQQAALVGQTWAPNVSDVNKMKITFGTGAFLLQNTGDHPIFNDKGLITTVAYKMKGKRPKFAVEGSIAFAGATLNWLIDQLVLVKSVEEANELAEDAYDRYFRQKHDDRAKVRHPVSDPCYMVPAFNGLMCPHWRSDSRAVLVGMDETCDRGAVLLAAYRSNAFMTNEILELLAQTEGGCEPQIIHVDGGLAKSSIFLQSLADITNTPISCPSRPELITSLGVALFACVASNIDTRHLISLRGASDLESTTTGSSHEPRITGEQRGILIADWQRAIQASCGWGQK